MIDYYSYHIGQEVGTVLSAYLPIIMHTIQTPLSSTTLLQKWRVIRVEELDLLNPL
jgi:hypothetical protein